MNGRARLWSSIGAGLLALCCAGAAHADIGPLAFHAGSKAHSSRAPLTLAQTLTGQAKADYDAARLLFEDGDYDGALVKFQRAFDEAGDVRLLWNMAVCEKSMRHYANMYRLLERYQRLGDAGMTDAHRAEVAEVLHTVRGLISSVSLSIAEPGATVYVDGVEVGTTPLSHPVLVDLGTRKIRVEKPGFEPAEVVREFAGGANITMNVTLHRRPQTGQIAITADPNSTISIDGKVMAQGQWKGTLSAGVHMLRVAARDMRPHEQRFELLPGQSRNLYITLQSGPSVTPAWVWIGVGVLAAGGLATSAYFLARPTPTTREPDVGTLGTVQLPLRAGPF